MAIYDFLVGTALPFLVVLTVLVFVHELGHFLIARRNGVRVEVFSIGFGPELGGFFDKHGTRWKFSAIPLGGYVKMFGEGDIVTGVDDVEDRPMTDDEKKVSFHHKKLSQRAAIVAAGPAANYLFAVLLLGALFALQGTPKPYAAVGKVMEGTTAEQVGLQKGDRFISIGGQDVVWFEDLAAIVSVNPDVVLDFVIERDGREVRFSAAPQSHVFEGDDERAGEAIGYLGVSPDADQIEFMRQPVWKAMWMGVEKTYSLTAQILGAVGEMIVGDRGAEELGGPLRIAQLSGQVAQGGMADFIFFMAALSVNLGLINLFPVPMLDGGHLVFYFFEAIRGKPLSAQLQEYGFRFGLVLVLLLMIFATWNDLVQLKVFEFLIGLVS